MTSAPNPNIMQAVEQLGYRVTVGDIAGQAGLNVDLAQQGLLALAADAGGHLQVAQTGEIIYLFPKNFRSILRNKYWRLRLKEWWEKIWGVLFYLIRISFGIILLASILLIFVTIAIILIAISSSGDSNNSSSDSGSSFDIGFLFTPDFFWLFSPDYGSSYHYRQPEYEEETSSRRKLNFLEAIFSFLFGDGDPNADLEKRRWQEIATVIHNNRGAVVAEQIAPYLDELGQGYSKEYEDYMLPALSRFNGIPQVSPEGDIVYHFPDLQTTAQNRNLQRVASYLQELQWRFSQASRGQILLAIGLGAVNFIGALVLGVLLVGINGAKAGGLVAFVNSIYGILLAYGIGFLAIPLLRYFWIQWKNSRIDKRNTKRKGIAKVLKQAEPALQKKIAYAQQFAAKNIIGDEDLAYTTETDVIQQEIEQSAQIDAEWQRRLEQRGL